MSITVIIRPEMKLKPYWFHCRFSLPAYPKQEWLDKAADECGRQFIADMNRQGFTYQDRFGIVIRQMPSPAVPITGAPSILERERFNARRDLDRILSGDRMRALPDPGYVASVPLLSEAEFWEYDLAAVFVHEELLVETPAAHEELEMLHR